MNRNQHSFAFNPVGVEKPRSTFKRNSTVKTTFNAGKLIPFYIDEVLPGDTFDVSTSSVVRMTTPKFPTMDDAFLDTFYFFCPSRLVYDHFRELMGENKDSAWVSDITYRIPSLKWKKASVGCLIDYFGLPVEDEAENDGSSYNLGDIADDISALPIRAYKLIWNEWFRDQNLQDPVFVNTSDTEDFYDFAEDDGLLPVCKYHDYFTSALPAPQKGGSVGLALDKVAVYPSNDFDYTELIDKLNVPLKFYTPGVSGDALAGGRRVLYSFNPTGDYSRVTDLAQGMTDDGSIQLLANDPIPYNLVADLSKSSFSVNDLRLAFQTQRVLELDARGGTRYNELILAHFGTHVPDATVQRPEYLGGKRINIRLNEVVQQSETVVTPLGNVAAFSKTTDRGHSFTKSFTEHGYVIGLLCVRYNHSYSQGINKLWTRKDRFDFYLPSFAFLGEQPIYNYEIFASTMDSADKNTDVFGYQEAWAEYRYKPSVLTGYMRPSVALGLRAWTYGDDYGALPVLSGEWVKEDGIAINRTLAVQDGAAHQFIADIYVENKTTRVMPVYSVPGLIDHF